MILIKLHLHPNKSFILFASINPNNTVNAWPEKEVRLM